MPISHSADKECFFITPIGDEGSDVRRRSDGVLAAIVEPAAAELGLVAARADGLAKPGQITLQVIDHVLGARAAVADLTGKNANVLYELAIRHTARLPVVLIAEEGETLPFDTAQMRTIFFKHTDLLSGAACKKELVAQLRQALDGNFDSPVATAVDVRALRSGNTLERTMAQLLKVVSDMSGELLAARREIRGLAHDIAAKTREPLYVKECREIADAIDAATAAARTLNLPDLDVVLDAMGPPIQYMTSRSAAAGQWSIRSDALFYLESAIPAAQKAAPRDNKEIHNALFRAESTVISLMEATHIFDDKYPRGEFDPDRKWPVTREPDD